MNPILTAISRLNMANNHPADAAEIAKETGLPEKLIRKAAHQLLRKGGINAFDYSSIAND